MNGCAIKICEYKRESWKKSTFKLVYIYKTSSHRLSGWCALFFCIQAPAFVLHFSLLCQHSFLLLAVFPPFCFAYALKCFILLSFFAYFWLHGGGKIHFCVLQIQFEISMDSGHSAMTSLICGCGRFFILANELKVCFYLQWHEHRFILPTFV